MPDTKELAESIEKAKQSVKNLRAEAAMLRESGEDLEDEEMLNAARRLEAQARKTEESITLGERTLKMIAERAAGVRR